MLLYYYCPPGFSDQMAVSAKLRQLAGQTQDNFNFGTSLLKGLVQLGSSLYSGWGFLGSQ